MAVSFKLRRSIALRTWSPLPSWLADAFFQPERYRTFSW